MRKIRYILFRIFGLIDARLERGLLQLDNNNNTKKIVAIDVSTAY